MPRRAPASAIDTPRDEPLLARLLRLHDVEAVIYRSELGDGYTCDIRRYDSTTEDVEIVGTADLGSLEGSIRVACQVAQRRLDAEVDEASSGGTS